MKPIFSAVLLPLVFLCGGACLVEAETKNTIYDPLTFGAKADGKTVDTAAIQQAIDRCSAEGGGTVLFRRGTYVSGTIVLKNKVTLRLDKSAVLKGSDAPDDFPIMESKRLSYSGTPVTNRMLIYAEDADDISILGEGTVDGNAAVLVEKVKPKPGFDNPSFSFRPRIIHFRNCTHVRIRDVTLVNAASWTQSYQSCSDMLIDGIRVRVRENGFPPPPKERQSFHRNSDGLDLIDCRRVRVSNCDIESGDDAICLKSFSTEEKCSDIAIVNCIVSSHASGIKCGTESVGGFEDIAISNCVIHDTRGDGIDLLSADGATLQRVTVSNIVLRNIRRGPIVLRLGSRDRSHRPAETLKTGVMKDIIISNIQGAGLTGNACSITGVPGRAVENVTFSDINLVFAGGGTREAALRTIPENEKSYPSGWSLGVLPAYGLYVRHAKNVMLDNLQFRCEKDELRPALICDDVEALRVRKPYFQGNAGDLGLVRLVDVRGALISGVMARNATPLFLHVSGDGARDILLHGNHPEKIGRWFDADKDAIRRQITLSASGE